LGVTKHTIRIFNPLLSIKLPKKEFNQGETVQFEINNPYIKNFYSPEDLDTYPYQFFQRYVIVPTYPSVYEQEIWMESNLSRPLIVPYDQDEYKIVLIRQAEDHSQILSTTYYKSYIADVANSTFHSET
jgi:hypothetical protein